MAIINTPLLGLPYAGADTDETYAVLAGLFVKDGKKLTLPEIVEKYTTTVGTVHIKAADWTAADGTEDAYDAKIKINGVEAESVILIYPLSSADTEKAKRLGIRAKTLSGSANDDTFVIVRATGGAPTVADGISLVYIAFRGYPVWNEGLTPPAMPYATVIGVDPYIATEEGDRDDIAASQRLVTEVVGLRLKSADLPAKLDEYRAAKGLIDKTVGDLVNYYNKSQTLTKDEINALVSAIPKFKIEVVTSLPASNISDTTVYLVKSGSDNSNLYTEYIRANGKWEKLGTQTVDLTGYATEAWVNDILASYVKTVDMEAYVAGLLKDYITKDVADKTYQPAGDYLTTADAPAIINAEVDNVVTERKEELRGEPGKDGKTPEAGVDYPTVEQVKTLIRTEVSAATAESFPKVSGVDQMTDTSKIYIKVNEGEEPYFWAYVTLHHPGSIEPDGFTDVLSTAIDQTGAIYNGCGYKNGWRVNSSGVETELDTATVTGFIACNKGDTIYMKGIQKHITNGHAIPYKSDFTKYGNPIYNSAMTENEDGTISFVAALGTNTGYIRIVGLNPFAEDAVISVNNPIKYKVVEPYDYQEWRAIYPVSVTDHTADIIALQDTVNEHTNEIAQLKAGVSGAVDMRVWDKPIYDTAPVVLIEGNTKPAVGDRNTVQAIYDAYDALMAAHPLYITKTAYKDKTADGQTLYRYDFQAPKPHEYSGGGNPDIVKPKIILISGIHYEMVGIWSLFHALEEIVTNPALRDIRRNAHLIVVPVCNPYCISGPYAATNNRKNANGVEIHRNFAVDHAVIDSTSNNYGGAEPLSEVETQHIDSILAANSDAVAFISCHSFDGRDFSKPFGTSGGGSDYGTTFMWASTATNYLYNVGGRFGVKMSEAWENKYGEAWREQIDAIVAARKAAGLNYQPEGDYTVGMAGKSNTPGTEAKHCMRYGIQGMTFEVAGNMMALDSENADSITITRGAEVYANLIATLLTAYDTTDKKAYKYIG